MITTIRTCLFVLLTGFTLINPVAAQNRPERLEWFRDLGFGMFIHWNVDGPLGGVISHSLVGASVDYRERYFKELPGLFNPRKYDPEFWAEQAQLAGLRARRHSTLRRALHRSVGQARPLLAGRLATA
ncbi:MAG: alpha-L-fucosidase, partial [Acidobacteriota bacterium]